MLKLAFAAGFALAALTGSAFAADLAAPAKGVIAAPAPSGFDGFYIGLNAGYGPGNVSTPNDSPYPTGFPFSGPFVGGQVGYNFVLIDNVVAGIEGDMEWTNETGNALYGAYTTTARLNWTGAVTGHLGVTMDNLMLYVLGGVAFANNTLTADDGVPASLLQDTQTHVGWVAGIGAAAKVSDNVSVFGEVRYAEYGSKQYSPSHNGITGLTDTSVRLGVNWLMK
jgi:outer membrane immunogenic protein